MKNFIRFLVILLCLTNGAAAFSQGLWDMPACAWTRKMGDRPVYSTVKHIDMGGAANILNLEGEPGLRTSEHRHEYEVWTGVAWNLAASMYHWGSRSNDEDLKRKALLTGKGVYMQCWLNGENGFWFGSPEALWFNDMPKARALMYQRARGVWELMKEVAK